MNQNTSQLFKAEDFNWNELETVGIYKEKLEKSGDMELLLQGETTQVIPLEIRTPVLSIMLDATLKIVEGPDGKPIVEINGLSSENSK